MGFKKLAIISSMCMILSSPLYAQMSDMSSNGDMAKPTAVKLTSGELNSLGAIAAIDKFEVLVSVLATNKKPSSGVADFAKMMIDQHGSNLTQILEMVNVDHATSLKSSTAENIATQGMKDMMKLGGLQGDQFDKAYADDMVKGHQQALDLIDHNLMKTAKSEQVKKFLTDTRAVVAQHLEDAKQLQASMKS